MTLLDKFNSLELKFDSLIEKIKDGSGVKKDPI